MGSIGVHDRIRLDVLHGRWTPGDKLQPVSLADVYDTSTTVVREALTRLAGEGFLTVERNRGFFVPWLSLQELRDLTELRCRTENLGVELAVERGDIAWESDLIAVHHRLTRTPRRVRVHGEPSALSDDWSEAHRDFHFTILEACGLPVLLETSERLWHRTELYRRWAAPSEAAITRDVEAEHAAILAAVLSRDAAVASALLRDHYERTVSVVLSAGLQTDGKEAPSRVIRA